MRVVKLEADNFKNLKAVEITPTGDMVVVGGKNEQGKSSVMDAIWVALKGRGVAPPKPIRIGEEECRIALDLGELRVIRKFTAREGGTYTDSVKVENAEGLRYGKPQEVLDALLGQIGFDPSEFMRLKPEQQADRLLQMVPLAVDLDDLAAADASDYQNRRDVNRDAAQVKAQLDGIPKEDVPEGAPDREALVARLGEAAETNSAIEHDRMARQQTERNIAATRETIKGMRDRADELRRQAETLDEEAGKAQAAVDATEREFKDLPPLPEPVDVAKARQELNEADAVLSAIERQQRRATLATRHEAMVAQSEGFTAAMAARDKERSDALQAAKMPIDGLAFATDERGKASVLLNGVPFEQASSAAKLKASTKIGMESNPDLRVLRISDGSLLDEDSMRMLAEMAAADDFQLWVEVVGEGKGVGIVMENGEVRAVPAAKEKPAGKAKEPAKADGALL